MTTTLACPACNVPLREYRTRQVCDRCDGMLLQLPDLAEAIREITGIVPAFTYDAQKPGKRVCPCCAQPMTTCRLHIKIEAEYARPEPILDLCAVHGLWFDGEELAGVFEKVMGMGPGGGGARRPVQTVSKGPSGSYGWRGKSGNPEWWGGGGGGKW